MNIESPAKELDRVDTIIEEINNRFMRMDKTLKETEKSHNLKPTKTNEEGTHNVFFQDADNMISSLDNSNINDDTLNNFAKRKELYKDLEDRIF